MTHDEMLRLARDQMKMGEDSARVVQQLVDRGVDKKEAMHIVEMVSNEMLSAPLALGPTEGSLLPAVLGGALAAVAGGIVWTLIFAATEYEIGFLAWGIGALCGFAVLLFSRGRRGRPLQIIAVVCSVLGILIGKYGIVYYIVTSKLEVDIPLFSSEMLNFFVLAMKETAGGYDILWIVLAVVTAWGIPKVAAQARAAGDAAAPE